MQLDLGADTVRWETMQPSDAKAAGLASMDSYRKCRRDKTQGGNTDREISYCAGGKVFTTYQPDKLIGNMSQMASELSLEFIQ